MKMSKYAYLPMTLLLFAGCSGEDSKQPVSSTSSLSPPAVQNSTLPASPIQKGTLAKGKLSHDAVTGVVARATALGVMGSMKIDRFVMQMPVGEPGSQHWKEKWIATDGMKTAEVDIYFQETGLGTTNWTIEQRTCHRDRDAPFGAPLPHH